MTNTGNVIFTTVAILILVVILVVSVNELNSRLNMYVKCSDFGKLNGTETTYISTSEKCIYKKDGEVIIVDNVLWQ